MTKTRKKWREGDTTYYVAIDQEKAGGMDFDNLFKGFTGTYLPSIYHSDISMVRRWKKSGLIFHTEEERDAKVTELNSAIKKILSQ